MLPVAFQLPAGLVLILVGLLACLAGYRLFRTVLTLYGFVLGALFASSLVAPSNVPAMLVALAVGGVAGALILFAGYFAGVMIVGAAFGALVLHAFWALIRDTEPHGLLVILSAAAGAGAAAYAQRHVVILATAFAGAQTAVAGVVASLASRGPHRPGGDDVWIGHLAPAPVGRQWPFFAWLALGLLGTFVQLRSGHRPRRRK
jgi:hypothetical protein